MSLTVEQKDAIVEAQTPESPVVLVDVDEYQLQALSALDMDSETAMRELAAKGFTAAIKGMLASKRQAQINAKFKFDRKAQYRLADAAMQKIMHYDLLIRQLAGE